MSVPSASTRSAAAGGAPRRPVLAVLGRRASAGSGVAIALPVGFAAPAARAASIAAAGIAGWTRIVDRAAAGEADIPCLLVADPVANHAGGRSSGPSISPRRHPRRSRRSPSRRPGRPRSSRGRRPPAAAPTRMSGSPPPARRQPLGPPGIERLQELPHRRTASPQPSLARASSIARFAISRVIAVRYSASAWMSPPTATPSVTWARAASSAAVAVRAGEGSLGRRRAGVVAHAGDREPDEVPARASVPRTGPSPAPCPLDPRPPRRRRSRSQRPAARAPGRPTQRRPTAPGGGSRSAARRRRGRSKRPRRSRRPRSHRPRPADRATRTASSARSTGGRSAAGSAWATLPPIVPRLRTWTSPIRGSASAKTPKRPITRRRAAPRMVSAPIATPPPSASRTPRSSPRRAMSMSRSGRASAASSAGAGSARRR